MAELDLARERRNAERIEECITAKRAEIDGLRILREENWRYLEENGLSRTQMAEWSGIDKMMVTRALGPKE
jgi:hypothetical protein